MVNLFTIDDNEIAHWVSAGVWQEHPLYAIVDHHATTRPDHLAVADQTKRLSYADFVARTKSLASWLIGLNLPSGSVVALQASSSVIVPIVHMACDRADLTFLPISDAFRAREVEHLLRLSRAAVAIVPGPSPSQDFEQIAQQIRADLPNLGVLASFGSGTDVDMRQILTTSVHGPDSRPTSPDVPRMTMITSGSTALPKISLYTDNNLYYFCASYADTVGLTPQDICVGFAPGNTGSTGYIFPVLTPLLFGASSIMLEHWNPVHAVGLLAQERPTVAAAVPTQMIKMLDVLKDVDILECELRAFTNAGAPLPPDVAAEVEDKMQCRVMPLYGATDGGVPVMTRITDSREKRHTTSGRSLPHTILTLIDNEGKEVGTGQTGEVLWRNPIKSLGYLNEEDRTAAAFTSEGLYRSGDLGQIDDEGYLRIVGRVKDLIIRGGQNISPQEIEQIAISHPDVAEVAVIGIPDQTYGERVCACIIPAPGCAIDLAQLNEYLTTAGLAAFKLPERIELFTEDFPRNTGAKISKPDLRELVMARERR